MRISDWSSDVCSSDLSWSHAFEVARCSSADAILALGLLLMFLFVAWLGVAQALYQSLFGYGSPASVEQFLRDIRSEERRAGKECVCTLRSRWHPYHKKQNINTKSLHSYVLNNP